MFSHPTPTTKLIDIMPTKLSGQAALFDIAPLKEKMRCMKNCPEDVRSTIASASVLTKVDAQM